MTDIEQPLISVIIPTFNRAVYLVEAIESVQAQTYQPVEIIVVDDGSTDHTAEAVSRFGSDIRYVWQPNQGAGSARNTGIAQANGELLAFLDSDDLWLPDKLTRQMKVLQANPHAEAVTAGMRQFYSPELTEAEVTRLWCPDEILPGSMPNTFLVWRSAFLRVGFFEPHLRVGEFMSWAIRAREAGLRMVDLEDCGYLRRVHTGNKGIARPGNFHARAAILKTALDRKRQLVERGGINE